MISQATGLSCRFGTSFFCGRWWGSIVHVIHLNTDSRRWGWLEYRGPSSLITNLACVVDASSLFKLILQFTNLTVLPCFLDGILPFPTTCGPSGTRRRWDFKVNFVAVILWANSHRLSLKLRLRHNWWLSESKITSWINNWGYRLRHISSTFNSFCHSTNPRSIHIHLSPQLQCLNHQHRWHLSPHHRVPMQPSMLKRWCNRWRTQWSPACKRSWSRTKSATWTNLLLQLHHQVKSLHLFQVILLHLKKFYHHHNTLIAALVLAPIDTVGHRTNVQSLFHEVPVEPHHRDEHIVHLDHGRHTGDDIPLRGIHLDVQPELHLSTYAHPLHVDEKYYHTMMILTVMNLAMNQLFFTLHRGNIRAIIMIHHPTTSTTSMTTSPLTSHPPKSGNPGTNGRTIPNLSLIPIHRVGLTIHKLPPNATATMNHPTTSLPTNLSLPFPLTVHVNLHTVPDQSNLVSPPVPSLQDMFPSIFKTVRERNGPVTSILPWIIQIGCELPMNSRETNALYRTLPFHRMNLMMQWNNSIGLTPEFQAMYVKRLSNCSPVPTSFRTMTFPHAMFVNFRTRTCLHSSCHCQTSVASRCHLLLAINIITPGHSVTVRPSKPLSWFSWRARSDRPTGHTTGIHKGAICRLLGPFILAEKSPMPTKPFRRGRKQPFLIPGRKRAKANKMSLWAQCIEEPMITLLFELVATKKPKSRWAKKVSPIRLRSTRLPIAITWVYTS